VQVYYVGPGVALSVECRVPLIREVGHPPGMWAVFLTWLASILGMAMLGREGEVVGTPPMIGGRGTFWENYQKKMRSSRCPPAP